MFVALASYSPDDPGFSYTGNAAPIHNRIGVAGAWLSDVLFFLFGWPAFLLPAVLAIAAWGLQRRVQGASVSRMNTAVRAAGFVLLLAASCGLTTLHWEAGTLRQTAGGVVGGLVGRGLASWLDFLGATLLLIAAWMAGLSVAFHVSWLTVMDRIGALTWAGIRWARAPSGAGEGGGRGCARGRRRRGAPVRAPPKRGRAPAANPPGPPAGAGAALFGRGARGALKAG